MENGATSETTVNDSQLSEPSILAGAIQESQNAILEAAPTKRRGRHPATCDCEKCVAKRNAPQVAKTPEVVKKDEKSVEVGIPRYFIEPIANAPFDFAAWKLKFPGAKLTKEEVEHHVKCWDAVLKRYAPKMESEHPEALALGAAIVFSAIGRFGPYQEHRAAQRLIEPQKTGETPGKVTQKRGTPNLEIVDSVKPSSALSSILDENQNPSF